MTAPYKPPMAPAPAAPQRPQAPDLSSTIFGAGGPASSPLVQAGLSLATDRGPQALLRALQVGQQAEQARIAAEQAEMQRRVREMLRQNLLASGDDPNSLLSAARFAMAHGDVDSAKELLDLAKAQQSLSLVPTQVVKNDKTGETWLVNTQTGQKIEQLYGADEEPALELTDIIALKNETYDDWRSEGAQLYYDEIASALRMLRENAAAALSGDDEAQEAVLLAVARIQKPQMSRGASDEQIAGMGARGDFGGKMMDTWRKLTTDQLNPDEIQNWINVVDRTVRSTIDAHDLSRQRMIRERLQPVGLGGGHLTDFFLSERVRIPGVSSEEAAKTAKIMEKP